MSDDLDLPEIPPVPAVLVDPAGNPPPAVAGGGGGFASLPAEDRAAVLATAMQFGITDQRDPVFQIIAALGWHLRLYERIPAQISDAGETAAERVGHEIEVATATLITIRDGLKTDFAEQVSGSGREFQVRATKVLLDLAKGAEMKKVVREVAADVARDVAIARARGLLGLGLVLASIAAIAILVAGVWLGRQSAADPQADLAKFYFSQLNCQSAGERLECRLALDPRQGVVFKGPGLAR